MTHSNQALNQLFEKIMALDIEEKHLLRLGRGEEDLNTNKDFSRYAGWPMCGWMLGQPLEQWSQQLLPLHGWRVPLNECFSGLGASTLCWDTVSNSSTMSHVWPSHWMVRNPSSPPMPNQRRADLQPLPTGVTAHLEYTCETAGHFHRYHIAPRWKAYFSKVTVTNPSKATKVRTAVTAIRGLTLTSLIVDYNISL